MKLISIRTLLTSAVLAATGVTAVGCAIEGSNVAEGDDLNAAGDSHEAFSTASSALDTRVVVGVRPLPTVTWTKVGSPFAAAKIAACGENGSRVYALNTDRTLYVSHNSGRDGSWQYMATVGGTQQILCAGNALYGFNDDRSVFKNIGTDTAVSWQFVGRPVGAKQLTGATIVRSVQVADPRDNEPVPGSGPRPKPKPTTYHTEQVYSPLFYALNDDGTFYTSSSGTDPSWAYRGTLSYTTRIAAGITPFEARPFALNTDQSFWLNTGDGCDGSWTKIDALTYTSEITASTAVDLYALNTDKTLWKGSISGSEGFRPIAANGQTLVCDGKALVTTTGHLDQSCWQGTCNAGLDCVAAVCKVHSCPDRTRDMNGQCIPCGATHQIACAAGGEWGCFDVHTAPDATGHCEFDNWCGTDGKPCCNADFFGGDCHDGTACLFRPVDTNRCGHQTSGGGGTPYNPCSAGQTLQTFSVCVDCNGGDWHAQSYTACSQAAATAAVQSQTQCRVMDGKCH